MKQIKFEKMLRNYDRLPPVPLSKPLPFESKPQTPSFIECVAIDDSLQNSVIDINKKIRLGSKMSTADHFHPNEDEKENFAFNGNYMKKDLHRDAILVEEFAPGDENQ